eukprot:915815-Pleurochrysis_carterae.AAC.6
MLCPRRGSLASLTQARRRARAARKRALSGARCSRGAHAVSPIRRPRAASTRLPSCSPTLERLLTCCLRQLLARGAWLSSEASRAQRSEMDACFMSQVRWRAVAGALPSGGALFRSERLLNLLPEP